MWCRAPLRHSQNPFVTMRVNANYTTIHRNVITSVGMESDVRRPLVSAAGRALTLVAGSRVLVLSGLVRVPRDVYRLPSTHSSTILRSPLVALPLALRLPRSLAPDYFLRLALPRALQLLRVLNENSDLRGSFAACDTRERARPTRPLLSGNLAALAFVVFSSANFTGHPITLCCECLTMRACAK